MIRPQGDGKILISGTSFGSPNVGNITRLNPDGTVDTSFGNAGTAVTTLKDGIEDLALLPGGNVLANGASDGQFSVVRVNANGTMDTTFGGGLATPPRASGSLASEHRFVRHDCDASPTCGMCSNMRECAAADRNDNTKFEILFEFRA